MATPWLLLQLADSGFPTGGFAHSAGLEGAWQAGELASPAALRRFAEDALWQMGQGALPLLRAAHQDPRGLPDCDARADALLVNHVANRASRTQGRALLDTCARVFAQVSPLRDEARAAGLCLHHAPVFGAALSRLGVPLIDAQQLYLSLGLRGLLGAGVRLGVIGTLQSQTLQVSLAATLDQVLLGCGELPLDSLAQTAPLADLLSATHDRLYSRLFQS